MKFALIILILFLTLPDGSGQEKSSPEKFLSRYVQFNSQTGNENEAGEFLAKEMAAKGLFVEILHNLPGKINITGSLYPLKSGKPNIVFLNHIDVVSPGDVSKWKYPPFSGAIAEGCVWGRGAIDNKGPGIIQIEALSDFVDSAKKIGLPYNITILFVSGEETGGQNGARCVAGEFTGLLNPVVVFGEGGTGIDNLAPSFPEKQFFGISVAEKGAAWFNLSYYNPVEYNHASAYSDEDGLKEMVGIVARIVRKKPIVWLSPVTKKMIHNLAGYEKGATKFAYKNIGLFKPFIRKQLLSQPLFASMVTETCKVTQFVTDNGSGNSHAHSVKAMFDCRVLRAKTREKFIARAERITRNSIVKLSEIGQTPALIVSEPEFFYSEMEKTILGFYPDAKVLPILFPAFSDNNYFREKGIPVFGILPVLMNQELIGLIHNTDERLPVELLHKGIEIYGAFMSRIEGLNAQTATY